MFSVRGKLRDGVRRQWTAARCELRLKSTPTFNVEYATFPIGPKLSPVVVAIHCSGSSYKQFTALATALETRVADVERE